MGREPAMSGPFIDLLTGKPYPQMGRRAVPIVGRWCACRHNHPITSSGNTGNRCTSCDCESYRRHVAEGA